MSLHVGEVIGDYEITAIIGAGSMGQVFQAEHRLTKRKEALKVMAAELASDDQVHRFQREIEVQARLSHPNIAAVHNALRVDEHLILVMELIEGRTLESVLKEGRVPIETGLNYVRQILAALNYAHALGVVHRDVTPANLIIGPDGTVKLTDFGVAKSLGDSLITKVGDIVGSLYYMAPERIRGGSEPDPRSDLYSVGAILYELVTGKRPFESDGAASLILAQAEIELRRPTEIDPTLPSGWDKIVATALAREPERRYQSAGQFLKAVDGVAASAIPGVFAPATRSLEGIKTIIAAAAASALVLFAVGGWANIWSSVPDPQPVVFPIRPPSWVSTTPRVRTKQVRKNVVQKAIPVPKPAIAKQVAPNAPPPIADSQPPLAEPKKQSFWHKLNPFRKKTAEAESDQQ